MIIFILCAFVACALIVWLLYIKAHVKSSERFMEITKTVKDVIYNNIDLVEDADSITEFTSFKNHVLSKVLIDLFNAKENGEFEECDLDDISKLTIRIFENEETNDLLYDKFTQIIKQRNVKKIEEEEPMSFDIDEEYSPVDNSNDGKIDISRWCL